MKEIILIAAAGENNELGRESDLPWHLPDDFKRFKELTMGHPMIMGRKTFDTFPKPLPGRKHIILTRDPDYRADHPACRVVDSMDRALEAADGAETVYIIGGGEIYRQALPLATKIELTRVHGTFPADTFFPEIDRNDWDLTNSHRHPADAQHAHPFTYQTYERKS
ncbi:dihydrofolate reductase [Robiginitalea biformata]|uniref:Dihydrofolate reductase n=1 Tax=Robiginitalea biformata (strain ATCC BAA-864 / DSM 15991 / KCTC 12146 / HTCC2501) TaxID=313596 RepID=A4CPT6_ROBBH|nr:dihydrofolate reductase [Robiginitalea biformata]EAR14407.1 Dihydrofolate reductase [Robiginitalea biformata HTCC2501]